MAVTYTVTEDSGFTHVRTSVGHLQAEYLFAVVRVPGGKKSQVSYCSRLDLALKLLAQAEAHTYQGERYYPHAKLYAVAAKVRA
jgi:hypothetical protein